MEKVCKQWKFVPLAGMVLGSTISLALTHHANNQEVASIASADDGIHHALVNAHRVPFAHLKLESSVLALVDGNFVNADTLERIYSFKRDVLAIMRGDKKNGDVYEGRYLFDGKKVAAQQVALIERDFMLQQDVAASNQAKKKLIEQRDSCLRIMQKDFLKASDKLKAIAYGAKPMMGLLIEESCKKRHRMDSILLLWAHTPEEKEDLIFEERVQTVTDFSAFCIDLLNFIGDLLYSCPKAHLQFEERATKWKQFELVLASLLGTQKPNIQFLKQIKLTLDKFALADLTLPNIRQLLDEFNKTKQR